MSQFPSPDNPLAMTPEERVEFYGRGAPSKGPAGGPGPWGGGGGPPSKGPGGGPGGQRPGQAPWMSGGPPSKGPRGGGGYNPWEGERQTQPWMSPEFGRRIEATRGGQRPGQQRPGGNTRGVDLPGPVGPPGGGPAGIIRPSPRPGGYDDYPEWMRNLKFTGDV